MSGSDDWVSEIAALHAQHHAPGCLGTVRFIDEAARLRGVSSVIDGGCVSLARPIVAGPAARPGDQRVAVVVESFVTPLSDLTVGTDRVEIDAHGTFNTHLDGPLHIGLDGHWHGGAECASVPDGDHSLSDWARHGLVTRAVLLDIPATRGTEWVEPDAPVTADDLERACARVGIEIERGDALLLYMGRDRFEAAGNVMPTGTSGLPRSGLGPDGAEWIARHHVSILCWDFLDAMGVGIPAMCVHRLIWAIGLVLIDNCDLGPAARLLADRPQPTALLSVGPLPIDGTTGCLVNPLLTW